MTKPTAYICDAIRTPIGRYAGSLSTVRADDLGAIPLRALMERNPTVNFDAVDDVIYGCANQSGEDNRNVARMSVLLAGLPQSVAAITINRLCGSSIQAIGDAARAIKCGEANLMIAGGVESMSRSPFVMAKPSAAFSRNPQMYDTTMGWRFINPLLKKQYGVDTMPETAENVAEQFNVSREDQDLFALRSQQKAAKAQTAGFFDKEITPVSIPRRKQDDLIFSHDEHPRETSLEALAKLGTPFRDGGTITAGNASGINDGACAAIIASEQAIEDHDLTPKAEIIAMSVAGLEPRIMGMGPLHASKKLLQLTKLSMDQMDTIEINEAFASQALACMRELGLADADPRVNPNGGAIALGHPLGMSGARLISTAINQLEQINGTYGLCSMCIGVGQGIAMIIKRC